MKKRKALAADAPHLEARPEAKKSKNGREYDDQDETEAAHGKRQGGGRKQSRGKEKAPFSDVEEVEVPWRKAGGSVEAAEGRIQQILAAVMGITNEPCYKCECRSRFQSRRS